MQTEDNLKSGVRAEGKGECSPCVALRHEDRQTLLFIQPCGKGCLGGHLSHQASLYTIWFDHDIRDLVGGHAGTCTQQDTMDCL